LNTDQKKKVLVIDDDETLREMMGAMLTRMGFFVMEAENGTRAIEVSESSADPIDIVIMDLFLPDIRGDKLGPKIIEKHPDLKLIVMSGYGLEDTRVLSTEVHGFIQKPCSYENLSKILENL
jgi:DNA-binding NtrC family response regulator